MMVFKFNGWEVRAKKGNGFWYFFVYDPEGKLRRNSLLKIRDDEVEKWARRQWDYARRNF